MNISIKKSLRVLIAEMENHPLPARHIKQPGENMLDGIYYFECICAHDEHTIRFTLDKEEKEIYTSVFLANHRNFFVRAILGIKYIFGGKSRYGYFGNWVLNPDDANKLEEMLKDFKNETS